MPNQGFRGDIIRISELTISAGAGGIPALSCEVQFTSEEGAVHAVATHHFTLDLEFNNDQGLAKAAMELLAITVRRVEALHYRQPNDSTGEVLRGISETLRAQAEETTSDEPGAQG